MKHILLILFTGLFLISCSGPRSATMCLSSKTGDYVKCPKGYEPGDIVEYNVKK